MCGFVADSVLRLEDSYRCSRDTFYMLSYIQSPKAVDKCVVRSRERVIMGQVEICDQLESF